MIHAIRNCVVAAGAAALLFTQAAYAAPTFARPAVDPLVSLSLLGTAQSRAAVCAASAASAAAAAAQALPANDCVFPVVDQPAAAPAAVVPPAVAVAPAGKAFPMLEILLGFAATGALIAVLAHLDDDDEEPISPA